MRSRFLILISALFLLLGAGCSSGPIRDIGLDKLSPRKAEQELSTGIIRLFSQIVLLSATDPAQHQ